MPRGFSMAGNWHFDGKLDYESAVLEKFDFIIASVDGAPASRNALMHSDSPWVASAAQFPRQMAELAVETGLSLLRGKFVGSKIILIPAQLITVANIGQYEGWGEQTPVERQP